MTVSTFQVTECGMTELLGKAYAKSVFANWYDQGEKFRMGDSMYGEVFKEVKKTLDECYEISKSVLSQHQEQLDEVRLVVAC